MHGLFLFVIFSRKKYNVHYRKANRLLSRTYLKYVKMTERTMGGSS